MDFSEDILDEIIGKVAAPDGDAMRKARERQAELAKPPGSLGRLEDLSVQLAGITGKVHNRLKNKYILVFCSDNGVCEEGVASAPQSVTLSQAVNMTRGKTGVAALAKEFGCVLKVCDVGIAADVKESDIIDRKISYGTDNIAKKAAMSREQAVRAVLTGAFLAAESAEKGADVIGIGEMGIGNTTTSSAVLSVLTGVPAEKVTGRGAGLTDEAYENKIKVIKKAVEINRPDPKDTIDVIAKVGGYDIAAMAGAFIGAAGMRVPVVIDGFISAVAALCAFRLCPEAAGYMIPSHASFEIGNRIAMEELGLKPLFDLGMRLGEGSGCPVAMSVLDAACAVMNGMATFEEADINDSYLDDIRKTDAFSVKGL